MRIRIQPHRRKGHLASAVFLQPFSRKEKDLRIKSEHFLIIFDIESDVIQ
jgi:hypothetical protein